MGLFVIIAIAYLASNVRLAATQTAVTGWTPIFSTFYGASTSISVGVLA